MTMKKYDNPNFCKLYGQVVSDIQMYTNPDGTLMCRCWMYVGPKKTTGAANRMTAKVMLKGRNHMAEAMQAKFRKFSYAWVECTVRAYPGESLNKNNMQPFTYFEVQRFAVDDVTGVSKWHRVISEQALNKLKRLALIGRKHLLSQGKNVKLTNLDDVIEVFGDDETKEEE